jgi:hypothetical protein
MRKPLPLLILPVLLVSALPVHAQSQPQPQFTIKGTILDSATHKPLVSATVYVKQPHDSTVLALSFTDAKGAFELKGIPRDKPATMRIFYTGYSRYSRAFSGVTKDVVDLGTIYLSMSANALQGVTITGERPPIAIKGDTIEFNASSFKTRPNSVLAGLLKKLPGVDVDKDGNITAQGEKVDKILVDGKKFFGDDPKIALENLPAAIVDKVQVTDTKTREEEVTGQPASGNTKTINITLKKGKDHGVFGRAYAGYGTGKHYDGSALLNYFEGKRRISVLGATNNINQVGFTVGEIRNLMGGGYTYMSSNGSFGINGINFGTGGEGVKKTTTAGLNYSDDFGKHFSVNGSYFYENLALDNETKTARQNILPDSVFYYNADNVSHTTNLNHRVTATLSYKDSVWKIYEEPYYGYSTEKGTQSNTAVSSGQKDALINSSNSLYTNEDHTAHFRNNLNVYRTFKKKGEYVRVGLDFDQHEVKGDDYNSYRNIFYNGNSPDDSVDQYINNHSTRTDLYSSAEYSLPVSKKLSVNIGYGLQLQHGVNDKESFDYNGTTGKYSQVDSAYSNQFRSNILTQGPQAGLILRLDSGKWYVGADADLNMISLHHYSYTHHLAFDQSQLFLQPRLYIRRKVGKAGNISLSYFSFVEQPQISQLLPVSDNTNPLYIVRGNPDLKPSVFHGGRVGYSNYDPASGNLISSSIGYEQMKDRIVSVTTYDTDLTQLTSYRNVNGYRNINGNLDLSKTKKKTGYHWQVKLMLYGNAARSPSFINGVPFTANTYNVNTRFAFTYGYKELFEITPSYRFNYQYSKYNLPALDNRQNTMYDAGFSGTLYWPSRFTWQSDWSYSRNSNVSPGFRKGYWLWNASVGLDLFKEKQGTLEFSVYDLLNQNVSVHRDITDTYIEDVQTVVLHRYFMLKFTYNLRKFGEKKKKEPKINAPIFFF